MSNYKPNPDNANTQGPNVAPGGTYRFSHATCPLDEQVEKRPTYVTINKVGTYAFLYETTASFGGLTTTVSDSYITGSVVQNAGAGGIKLDISPLAWRRCDAAEAIGDVTFVYVRLN